MQSVNILPQTHWHESYENGTNFSDLAIYIKWEYINRIEIMKQSFFCMKYFFSHIWNILFRLKKIQKKKKSDLKKKEKIKEDLKRQGISVEEGGNILEEDHDEDLLFD